MNGGLSNACTVVFLALLVCTALGAADPVPSITLNNGVQMPRLSISLPATAPEATANIQLAVAAGITHFVTANDYLNQQAVGQGLAALGVPRSSYFVTTMTSPCQCSQTLPHCQRNITDLAACAAVTKQEFLSDLQQLNLSYVDLILLHGPNLAANHTGGCNPEACDANRAQWRAYMELYRAGKARAIGVGNYCPSCFECLLSDPSLVVPAVNQIQYHVAYGSSAAAYLAYFGSKGIVPWAYEPLAKGLLARNAACASIGAKHNKTAAQVAMRWIAQNPTTEVAILTRSNSSKYLAQDAQVFGWKLSEPERRTLDRISCTTNPELCTAYDGRIAWGCTE